MENLEELCNPLAEELQLSLLQLCPSCCSSHFSLLFFFFFSPTIKCLTLKPSDSSFGCPASPDGRNSYMCVYLKSSSVCSGNSVSAVLLFAGPGVPTTQTPGGDATLHGQCCGRDGLSLCSLWSGSLPPPQRCRLGGGRVPSLLGSASLDPLC